MIGARWNILEKLSHKKYYVHELSDELGKKAPQTSRELKELEEKGLVEHKEEKGDNHKYYYASDYAERILNAVTQVTKPEPKRPFKEWLIDEFLCILEDEKLSERLRRGYSDSFYRFCIEQSEEILSNKRARKYLEDIVANPFRYDEINLKRFVSAVLKYALNHEEWSDWIRISLYPIFVNNAKIGNAEVRAWSVEKMGEIVNSVTGLNGKSKTEVMTSFEELVSDMWFSQDTDPDSNLGRVVMRLLTGMASRSLFEKAREKAKVSDEKVRSKAEKLLEGLKDNFM